jgi:uncharacterized damage-inducible protein DinB
MPNADYARMMARYSAWQNKSLVMAADSLDEEARLTNRGAFFGSIAATLNHLLWGDRVWMSRFAGTAAPNTPSITASLAETDSWEDYMFARGKMDAQILDWATKLDDGWFAHDLTWWSGAAGREISKPKRMLVTHFFNHGTHHRGQVHAMLTAAGAEPEDTDLFLMP